MTPSFTWYTLARTEWVNGCCQNENAFIEIFLLFIMSVNNTTSCYYLSMEEAQDLVYSTTETVMITVLQPVVSVIGILLNYAFLITLYRVKDMRTTTNIYLAIYLPIRYTVTPFTNRFICGIPLLLIFPRILHISGCI